MKDLRSESLSNFEIQNLFRHVLKPAQICVMSKIIKALAKYIVLDQEMLYKRCQEVTMLSYLVKCIKYKLVTEYVSETDNIHIYKLNSGGVSFMQGLMRDNFINNTGLDFDISDMEKVLTFNRYALEHNYSLLEQPDMIDTYYRCLICKNAQNELCMLYLEEYITKEKIISILSEKYKEEPETIEEKFSFIEISETIKLPHDLQVKKEK